MMTEHKLTRRQALAQTGVLTGAALALPRAASAQAQSTAPATAAAPATGNNATPFRFCLNTATIRGQKLGITKEIEVASKAGYDGIEPWVDSVQEFMKNGGTPKELRQRLADAGLTVEGAIGFPDWIVDDDERRAKGVERAKREMELMASIGARRFAAPPAGATDLPKLDLYKAADRYRVLLDAGDSIGIVPELELWGFSKNLNRLSECVLVAMETGHPKACVLADVFHLYKGGSDFHALRCLAGDMLQVFHMNDVPTDIPREKLDDSLRVFPGDGMVPIPEILRVLRKTGGPKVLSLELFNRGYWQQDPLEVAKAGLAKMKAVAEKAA